jgi:hypothetical protein
MESLFARRTAIKGTNNKSGSIEDLLVNWSLPWLGPSVRDRHRKSAIPRSAMGDGVDLYGRAIRQAANFDE